MGFTTGFTGGVTVVLGAAYLTLQAHQRNREQQAAALRHSTYVLNSLSYVPAGAAQPKTVAEELAILETQQELLHGRERHRAALARRGDSILERAKDRWNAEVEGVVRWAATRDWVAAREDAEDATSRIWSRVTGGETPAESAGRAGAVVGETAAAATGAARSAVEQARAKTNEVARVKTAEAKEAASSIWEMGFTKSKEAAGAAKAAIGLAGEKAQEVVKGGQDAESEVERALQQRFEERNYDEVMSKSVEEVLEERYKPIAQRDNSKLRGL